MDRTAKQALQGGYGPYQPSTCHTAHLMNEINQGTWRTRLVPVKKKKASQTQASAHTGHTNRANSDGKPSTLPTQRLLQKTQDLRLHTQRSYMPISHTCRENARSAGMGMRAAIKKAVMLLMEVKATLAPVLFKHSPVRSCNVQKHRIITLYKQCVWDEVRLRYYNNTSGKPFH